MFRFSGEGAAPAVLKFEASREILRAKDALQDDSTCATVNSPTGHQGNGTGLPNVEVIRLAGVG